MNYLPAPYQSDYGVPQGQAGSKMASVPQMNYMPISSGQLQNTTSMPISGMNEGAFNQMQIPLSNYQQLAAQPTAQMSYMPMPGNVMQQQPPMSSTPQLPGNYSQMPVMSPMPAMSQMPAMPMTNMSRIPNNILVPPNSMHQMAHLSQMPNGAQIPMHLLGQPQMGEDTASSQMNQIPMHMMSQVAPNNMPIMMSSPMGSIDAGGMNAVLPNLQPMSPTGYSQMPEQQSPLAGGFGDGGQQQVYQNYAPNWSGNGNTNGMMAYNQGAYNQGNQQPQQQQQQQQRMSSAYDIASLSKEVRNGLNSPQNSEHNKFARSISGRTLNSGNKVPRWR